MIRIDLPVLAFSVGIAIFCGILFGLAPALRLSISQVTPSLQTSSRRIPVHASKSRLNTLIASQTALTLLLMATGATTVGAFLHIMQIPLGYNPHNVLILGIMTHWRDPARAESSRSLHNFGVRQILQPLTAKSTRAVDEAKNACEWKTSSSPWAHSLRRLS